PIILIPVVESGTSVLRACEVQSEWLGVVLSGLGILKPAFKVHVERNVWGNLEALRFINRFAESIPQPKINGKVAAEFPAILNVKIVLFRSKFTHGRGTTQRVTVQIELEVRGVLRQTA